MPKYEMNVAGLLNAIGEDAIPADEFENCSNQKIKKSLDMLVDIYANLKKYQELLKGCKEDDKNLEESKEERENRHIKESEMEQDLWNQIDLSIQSMGDLSEELGEYNKENGLDDLVDNPAMQRAIELGFACKQLKAMTELLRCERNYVDVLQTFQDLEKEEQETREKNKEFIQKVSKVKQNKLWLNHAKGRRREREELKKEFVKNENNKELWQKISDIDQYYSEEAIKYYENQQEEYKKYIDSQKEMCYNRRKEIVEKQRQIAEKGMADISSQLDLKPFKESVQSCLQSFLDRAMDGKNKGHKDTKEFKDMYNTIQEIGIRMKDPAYVKGNLDADMERLKNVCTTYIQEKQKGWHPFENTQRTMRLNFANSVLGFVENIENSMKQMQRNVDIKKVTECVTECKKIGRKNKTLDEYVAGLMSIGTENLTDRVDDGLEMLKADEQVVEGVLKKAARNIKEGPQDNPQLDFSRFAYKMESSKEVGRNKCLERYFDDLQHTPDYIKAITPFAKKTTEPVKKTNRDIII